MSLQLTDLAVFQMGSNVVWKTMMYIAWSARAFSMIRQPLPVFFDSMLSYVPFVNGG